MDIKISAHAKKKAAERGITEEGIRVILAEHPAVETWSKTDPSATLVHGMYGGEIWVVVLNNSTQNVITVRRADKNERRHYDKRKRIRNSALL